MLELLKVYAWVSSFNNFTLQLFGAFLALNLLFLWVDA